MLVLASGQYPLMTAQNLQDILDTKYGQPASQPLIGPTDCP